MKRISEYVSLGHPDKTADYISEYLLDRYLEEDSDTRYAVEVQVKDKFVTLGGEITSLALLSDKDIDAFVRDAITKIGYSEDYAKVWGPGQCLDPSDIVVEKHISIQSSDIARGVARGWGDQGIFFGYAEYGALDMLPVDHQLARYLCNRLYKAAKMEPLKGWGIDIKTQVVLPQDSNNPEKIIVAIPLKYKEGEEEVREYLGEMLRRRAIPLPGDIIINGTGKYEKHSSMADCGTTGRKLAVDFYGGNCRIGGGSPWTKDGSKADLTLNLYARYMAKELAERFKQTVTVSLGSCIGRPEVDYCAYGEAGETLKEGIRTIYPEGLRRAFHLCDPIYAEMCEKGLFGSGFDWDIDVL